MERGFRKAVFLKSADVPSGGGGQDARASKRPTGCGAEVGRSALHRARSGGGLRVARPQDEGDGRPTVFLFHLRPRTAKERKGQNVSSGLGRGFWFQGTGVSLGESASKVAPPGTGPCVTPGKRRGVAPEPEPREVESFVRPFSPTPPAQNISQVSPVTPPPGRRPMGRRDRLRLKGEG